MKEKIKLSSIYGTISNESKEDLLKYIKGFSQIKITYICKELGIDPANLWHGKISVDNMVRIKWKINEELEKLNEDSTL